MSNEFCPVGTSPVISSEARESLQAWKKPATDDARYVRGDSFAIPGTTVRRMTLSG